ncbi:asparagine synthase-related protein [Orrella sp. 11846]|uniref:asparagine synthase-related protein n=1 Tax=Orrella sp. 11846 TaxID=3409913 RepID=UPI003B5C6317
MNDVHVNTERTDSLTSPVNSTCSTQRWRDGTVFVEGIIQRVGDLTGLQAREALIQVLDRDGPSGLAQVQGDFVAIIETAHEIYAYKSLTSQFQIFYRERDRVVANRLYTFWDEDSVWNQDYFARHCFIVPGHQCLSVETPLVDVQRVLPGELVTFRSDRVTRQQLVQRQYRYNLDRNQSREEMAPEILRLLRDSVETRLQARPDAEICVEISGGLDSSFIACLLGEHPKRPIRGVMFSQPDIPSHAVSEQYAREVAHRYDIDLTVLPPEALPRGMPESPSYSDEPSDFFWYGDIFSRAVAEIAAPGSYIFTGYGADQLFLRSPAFLPYLLEHGEYSLWKQTLPGVSRLLSRGQLNLSWQCLLSLIPAAWHRALLNTPGLSQLSAWDISDVNMDRMLTNEVSWLRAGKGLNVYSQERRQAEADLFSQGIICDDWGYFSAPRTVCQAHFDAKGLVDASPFCDLALLDYIYNEVSAFLIHDFEVPYKSLLRQAQAGVVPESLRQRKSDTFVFNSFQLRYIEDCRAQFDELLQEASSDWIDLQKVQLSLEQLSFGMATSDTRSVVALLGYLQWQKNFMMLAPTLQKQPEAEFHRAELRH